MRAHQGVPEGPKMASGWLPQGSISAIFGPLGPPGGPPGVLILVYHFILLPLDRISVRTTNLLPEGIRWEQNRRNSRFWSILVGGEQKAS